MCTVITCLDDLSCPLVIATGQFVEWRTADRVSGFFFSTSLKNYLSLEIDKSWLPGDTQKGQNFADFPAGL